MVLDALPVVPGHSLGFMALGSSLYEVLTTIKQDKERYPQLDLSISQSTPLYTPVVLALPENGLRLRFDGPEQRLRLIEVLDFARAKVAYKGSELVKDGASATFKRIYQLFGASYPGEYIPPNSGRKGTYVLSWPGVAFMFPLQHSAWAPEKDHVSLLGSQAASSATFMAIFEGISWQEARNSLFTSIPNGPRTAAVSAQQRDALPAEVEEASIEAPGRLRFVRRSPAIPFEIILGQTTPQDLLTELGPPEKTHKRDGQVILEPLGHSRPRSTSRSGLNGRSHATPPSSYSSTGTDTFETDFDSGEGEDDASEKANREMFWCYFAHGMDILIGPPNDQTSVEQHNILLTPLSTSPHLVVLKVVIHGNIPGSYAFNRHRRLRWQIHLKGASSSLHSEHSFDEIKPDLMQAFYGIWPEAEMGRGKVINRTWGAGSSDSSFFLPDAEQDLVEGGGSESFIDNSKLHNFPGLTFEVLSNGAISTLTVS